MFTGLPPFYRRCRSQLFENIEKGLLDFPLYVKQAPKCLIQALLKRDPMERLGGGNGGSNDVKAHKFWTSVNWDDVLQRNVAPPFRPQVFGRDDYQYFHDDFLKMAPVNSEVHDPTARDQIHFDNFNFYSGRAEYPGTPTFKGAGRQFRY